VWLAASEGALNAWDEGRQRPAVHATLARFGLVYMQRRVEKLYEGKL
jgi:hypothetical protein